MDIPFFSTSEARKNLGSLVSQAKFQGKQFAIGRHGKAEAYIVPAAAEEPSARADIPLFLADKKAMATLARKYNLSLIVLFGSHARGSARADSDIDIAVQPKTPLTSRKEEAFYHDLVSLFHKDDVDVINLDTHEDVVLRYQIFIHGKPIYEADPDIFPRLRMRAYFDYQDFKPYLAMRERLLEKKLDHLIKTITHG